MKGLDKLKALDEKVLDEKGVEVKEQKQGVVKRGDKGFNELMKILKENHMVGDEFQEIILVEVPASIGIGGISPSVVRILALRQDEKEEIIKTDPFDPDKPIRDLRNWVGDYFRKQLAYWMLGVLGMWLLANSYMLYLLNKP